MEYTRIFLILILIFVLLFLFLLISKKDKKKKQKEKEKIKFNHIKPDVGDRNYQYKKDTFVNVNVCLHCGLVGYYKDLPTYNPCPKCGHEIQEYKNNSFGKHYIARWELYNNEWQWVRPIHNYNKDEREKIKRKRKLTKIKNDI